MRPLRSLLSTPANRPTMIDKAAGFGADAIILDLEDSVPIAEKGTARDLARDAVGRLAGQGVVTYVRVNGLESGMLEADLEAIVGPGLEGIQLPKVDTPDTIWRVDRLLGELEVSRGVTPGAVELFVSLESARGVFFAYEILSASPRVGSVMIGTAENADLQGDLGFLSSESEEALQYLRSRVLLAARVAGLTNPVDGVYADYRNLAGLEASARRARRVGYRGKKVIHPAQIEIVNRVFSPTSEELDFHRRVIETFDEALTRGEATAAVDGRMIDYAVAETARRILHRAGEASTERGPETST